MPYADPEEKRAADAAHYAANRERINAHRRARHASNRERLNARRRELQTARYAANRESEQRFGRIHNWERHGVNPWPYASHEELHDQRYAVAEHCEYCGPIWGDFATLQLSSPRNPRDMEHDHRPPFLFRAICCHCCNVRRGIWDRRILAVITELTPRYLRWWRRRHRTSTG